MGAITERGLVEPDVNMGRCRRKVMASVHLQKGKVGSVRIGVGGKIISALCLKVYLSNNKQALPFNGNDPQKGGKKCGQHQRKET